MSRESDWLKSHNELIGQDKTQWVDRTRQEPLDINKLSKNYDKNTTVRNWLDKTRVLKKIT